MSYKQETFTTSSGRSEMDTYTFSDGEVWTATAFNGQRKRVTRQDHETDFDHRASMAKLVAKLDGHVCMGWTKIATDPKTGRLSEEVETVNVFGTSN